jgi:hypothetical protein
MSRSPRLAYACLLGAILLGLGCGGREPSNVEPVSRVQIPPRLELADWGTIGIVDFAGGADAALGERATREFVQMLMAAQPDARIIELGDSRRVLAELGHGTLDFEAARALGERYRVDAVFTGTLELGKAKPQIRIGQALASMRARADVTGQLDAKLLETSSGAVVWTRSSSATANVASVGVPPGGLPSFSAKDPADAHAGLIRQLVSELRYDFYPTWE